MTVLAKIDSFEDYAEYEYSDYHKPDSSANAASKIDGINVNPLLPKSFDDYPLEKRCAEELEDWLNRAYIVTNVVVDAENSNVFINYTVRKLDGKCWDRSTNCGSTSDLKEAIRIAKSFDDE